MRKIYFFLSFALAATLSLGYYRETGEAQMYTYTFIKKHPTFQIKFENIFANPFPDKRLSDLSQKERHLVIDYCKYRLGIETQLQTQNELEQCKKP